MVVVIRPTNVANNRTKTEVDLVLLVDAKMTDLFTTVLSIRVSRVSVMVRARFSVK